ncbi:flagellar basal body rod protein FlgF [Sphingomonas abietis]|uniref:Flagellar basal-body rod protein FlgF n=1 Tax=Sphingomonas abietis TaxID=3012344 RepID=A0ABY7NKS6_9SPHN|nr:flagellar basal body rod protein FlgF [Sphingomonas abietis]WBO22136.1 flagellar basal body rod protein FlgF [Sphingomonas abietis]
MDQLIYTSLSAMRALMQKQVVTANNLANVNTVGFRGDMTNSEAVYLTNGGDGVSARAQASDSKDSADMGVAANVTTGRDLDVAMNGDTLLAVQATDGTEAYTRRGDLQVADSGLLVTGDGLPVMGEGGSPITLPPVDSIRVDNTGVLWIVPQGGDPTQPQQIEHLKLVSAKGSKISKSDDGLFHVAQGGSLPSDPNGRLTSGALEGSNVNVTKTLTDMIDASRAWETQVKMLAGAKEMDTSTAQLMDMSGQ